jgi:phosphatidate cytidylyltransferase
VKDTAPPDAGPTGELGLRIVSGIVMAALAIGATVLGGWPFVLFWAAAALGVFWEWTAIVADGPLPARISGAAALAIAALAVGVGQDYPAFLVIAFGAPMVASSCASRHVVWDDDKKQWIGGKPWWTALAWGAAGMVYAGTVLLAPVLLRRDPEFGLAALLFLFAIVWATDILGFFIGRAVGGPKLAPSISPKKTWSGACGGALGALAASATVVYVAGNLALIPAACVALLLSMMSQAGDLFESAVKRRFGVKDASHVIPGHGGLMDRLDGFIVAAGTAALIGLARAGPDASARGLLLW